jgi:curli biogenesis system outer membrane secretion channel CsgG
MKRNKIVLFTLILGLTAGAAHADYVAYAQTKKGEELPLPENAREIVEKNAKNLVGLRWGDYNGKKIRIGVLEADNQSGTVSYSWRGGEYSAGLEQVPVNGIDALLTDALTKTGRFTVLTRTGELDDVLDEQDLGDSGRVAKPSAAKIGNVLGAQYLVQVVVNDYAPDAGGKKVGLGAFSRKLRAVGGASVGKKKSSVQMTFKLINAETSEIMASEVVNATISDMSLGVGGGGWGGSGAMGGFLSGYSKTPIGQAVMAATNIGVLELIKQVGNLPVQGSVVKVEEGRAIVNLGEGTVESGDLLTAVSQGEDFVDPETGLSLGAEEEELGMLKVTSVKEKYCYAEAVGFELSTLTRGDKVRTNSEPEPLQFGPDWKN